MEKTKHTPAPWGEIYEDELLKGYPAIFIEKVGYSTICIIESELNNDNSSFSLTDESWANAYLIGAAPEMLEALRAACSALRSYQYGNSATVLAEDCANHIEKVIAKAEGRDD